MAYTKADERTLQKGYDPDNSMQSVKTLCVKLNQTPHSVIAKLSKMGLYKRTGYRDKLGNIPETKPNIVRDIEMTLEIPLLDLYKAPKSTLRSIRHEVLQLSDALDEALNEVAALNEELVVLRNHTNVLAFKRKK